MQTKQRIYEVAKVLYIQEGYKKVSNKRLAEKAGVNQGLITYYFKSKANIATTIWREMYQIQSSYLKNLIDVYEEPLLFNISVDNLMSRLSYCTQSMTNFMSEMITERVLLDNVYNGGQKNDIMIMLRKLVPKSRSNPNKYFRRFVAMTFPVAMEFQLEIWKGLDMSYEEYFETMVGLFIHTMDLSMSKEEKKALVEKSNATVLELMEAQPQLKDPKEYLFHKNAFNPSIVEELLDLN